jgi:hypothetical protein
MASKRKKLPPIANPLEHTLFGRTISPVDRAASLEAIKKLGDPLKLAGQRALLGAEVHKLRLAARARQNRPAAPVADIAGIREIARKVLKRKLIAPASVGMPGGLLEGSYRVRHTPPYDYDFPSINATDKLNSVVADSGTGELGFSVFADLTHGLAFTDPANGLPCRFVWPLPWVGIYFVPVYAPGELSISLSPTLGYAWWTESTGMPVQTFASFRARIVGFPFGNPLRPEVFANSQLIELWDTSTADYQFDWGSATYPMTVSTPTDGTHYYMIYLEFEGQVRSYGTGAQASRAAAAINCLLPYIDVDFRYVPTVKP